MTHARGALRREMSVDARERDSRRTLAAVTATLLLLLPSAYVLGIGPAARLAREVPATRPALSAIYVPLESTALTYGFPLSTYACYMHMWGVPTPPFSLTRLCESREFW